MPAVGGLSRTLDESVGVTDAQQPGSSAGGSLEKMGHFTGFSQQVWAGKRDRDQDDDWRFVYHQKRTARREWDRFICLDRRHFDDEGRLHGEATRDSAQSAPAAR